MTRQQGSAETRANVQTLRNNLCRLGSPELMARVSGHLRNFAVAEIVATLGVLDSHPHIKGRPKVGVSGAAFQQTTGTHPNPFTHVAPSNLLLNEQNLTEFFNTRKARAHVERVFGMGVMAPTDWAESPAFLQNPGQLNKADHSVEHFGVDSGLVAAFEHTAAAALAVGTWNASSKHQHDASSLVEYVGAHYRQSWKPKAVVAYEQALSRMGTDLSLARNAGDDVRKARTQHRIDLVSLQLEELLTNTPSFSGAVENVLAATAEERWA